MKKLVSMCAVLGVFCLSLAGCGGGGDGGGGAAVIGKGPSNPAGTTVYTASDSSKVYIAKVYDSGTTVTTAVVDCDAQEVYYATASIGTNGSFTMPSITIYGGRNSGVVVASVTGTVTAGSITATVTPTSGSPSMLTLNSTTNANAGIYYGSYGGSSSGIFVAGISGSNAIRGFEGSDKDGWGSYSTSLIGASFSGSSSSGSSFSGTLANGNVSGTWSNSAYSGSGTFQGPKVF